MLMSGVISRFMQKRVLITSINMKHIWTAQKTVMSPFDNIIIPELTVSEYVWRNLDKWSDKIALVCGITNRKYTYYEIYKQSQTFGANLRKKYKIKDGDAVAVILQNSPEYPVVVLGILAAGGIVTTINPLYTVYEVKRQLMSSGVKLIVTEPGNFNVVKEALNLNGLNTPVIAMDIEKNRPEEAISYKEIVNDNNIDKDVLKEVKRNPQDTALLLYSSGTTGLPKAVELTNRNKIANCEQQNDEMCKKFTDTTEKNQDTLLAYLPMFHAYGLSIIMLHKLSLGLKLVTLPQFSPDTFVAALEQHHFNLLYMAPPTVLFLASYPQVKPKHFEKLRHVIIGAAPLPEPDINKFLSKIEHDIDFGQCYGLTEASPVVTVQRHDIDFSQVYGLTEAGPMVTAQKNNSRDYTSVGYGMANSELRVVDSESKNLGPNEMGELLVKGPNIMKGYKDNPEANSQVFVNEWLRTGDLAKIDEYGCVIIADRLKELIKVNAYQVAPAELESVIKEHPAIFDAAVVGISDDNTGQKPKGFAVLNKDMKITKEEILQYVNEKVAPYKRLKDIQFVDDIPKNPSGKILRRLIVEQYC